MSPKLDKKKKKALEEARKAELEREEAHQEVVLRMREVKKIIRDEQLRINLELKLNNFRILAIDASIKCFEEIIAKLFYNEVNKRSTKEWEHFLHCDGTPNPYEPPSLNMYLYVWKLSKFDRMENVLESIENYLPLLTKLNYLLEIPLNASDFKIENWKEVRQGFRDEIIRKVDEGTYDIIKECEKKMVRLNYWHVNYKCLSNNVKICMFASLPFPLSEVTERTLPIIDFSPVGVILALPVPYDRKPFIARIIQVTFDILSDTCKTFKQPLRPENGTVTEIVDYWIKRKLELALLRWTDKFKALEIEKKRLTVSKPVKKKKKKKKGQVSEGVVEYEEVGEEESTAVVESIEDEECWKRFHIIIKGMTVKQLQRFFKPNIKEDVLDCFFNIETGKQQNIGQIIIRKLVKEAKERNLHTSLLSLRIVDKLMNNLLDYFSEVPIAFEEEEEREVAVQRVIVEDEQHEDQEPEEEGLAIAIYDETRESVMYPLIVETMTFLLKPGEVNLRSHAIIGDVYYFDFIKHVPQKMPLEGDCFIQVLVGDYKIEKDDFLYVYIPPPPFIPKSKKDIPPPDLEIIKLIHIKLVLPKNILLFESPKPVLWHYEDKAWSSRYVHGVKVNDEDKTIEFNIGRALPFALSITRFTALPYQAWELRPEQAGSNTVQFILTTSQITIEFKIKGLEIAMMSVINSPNPIIREFCKKFFRLGELINLLRSLGLDIFPEDDTFLYVNRNTVKDYIIEEQVYMAMAIFSQYFQFKWSRWNSQAGWGKLVYQTRQLYSRKQLPDYLMIMSDLFHTTIINCSEDDEEFTEESIPDIIFNADLYTLLKNICSPKVKHLVDNYDIELINTVNDLLRRTKVFSFA